TPDRFLSFAEVADLIGLDVHTLKKGRCGTGDIPRIRLGARVLFSLNAVQRWMERKAREAEEHKRRQEIMVVAFIAERRRGQKVVTDSYTTFVNGGRYQR